VFGCGSHCISSRPGWALWLFMIGFKEGFAHPSFIGP
jgi:hypothetical protein